MYFSIFVRLEKKILVQQRKNEVALAARPITILYPCFAMDKVKKKKNQ